MSDGARAERVDNEGGDSPDDRAATGSATELEAERLHAALRAELESRAQSKMASGVLWLLGGLALTGITYAAVSESGGTYLIATGPVAYGVVAIFQSLSLRSRLADLDAAPRTSGDSPGSESVGATTAPGDASHGRPANAATAHTSVPLVAADDAAPPAPAAEIRARASELTQRHHTRESIGDLLNKLGRRAAGWVALREAPGRVVFAAWDDAEFKAFTEQERGGQARTVERAPTSYGKINFQLAAAALEREDWPTAQSCVERGLEIEPDAPLLWCARGVVYEYARKPDWALACYRRAAALHPWNAVDRALAERFAEAITADER